MQSRHIRLISGCLLALKYRGPPGTTRSRPGASGVRAYREG